MKKLTMILMVTVFSLLFYTSDSDAIKSYSRTNYFVKGITHVKMFRGKPGEIMHVQIQSTKYPVSVSIVKNGLSRNQRTYQTVLSRGKNKYHKFTYRIPRRRKGSNVIPTFTLKLFSSRPTRCNIRVW